MRLRTTWEFFVLLLVLTSVTIAVVTDALVVLVFLVVCGAALSALGAWATTESMDVDSRRACARAAWWGTLGAAALPGWVTALGPWGLVPVVCAALTFPDLVGHLAAARRGRRSATRLRLHRMSDEELLRRWVTTTRQLQRPLRPAVVEVLAEERDHILDELGDRDPARLTRWLGGEHSWEELL